MISKGCVSVSIGGGMVGRALGALPPQNL